MDNKTKINDFASELFKMKNIDSKGIDNYYFDDFFNAYIKQFFPQFIEWFNYIWDHSKDELYGDNDFSFEKVLETKNKKVLLFKHHATIAEISKFLIIYETNDFESKFDIRKVWDYKKSDYKKNSKIVERPNLKWYKDRKYNLKYDESLKNTPLSFSYGDCRDSGFVLSAHKYSMNESMINKTNIDVFNTWYFENGMIHNYNEIKFVSFHLNCAVNELHR